MIIIETYANYKTIYKIQKNIMKSLNPPFYPPVKPPVDSWIDESGVQERGLGWLDIQIGSPQWIHVNQTWES